MASCNWLVAACLAASCGAPTVVETKASAEPKQVAEGKADDGLLGSGPVDPPGASAAEGRALFHAMCSGCHGPDAKGNTRAKHTIFPAPRDLTRAEYRFRSTVTGALPTRADMKRTLAEGLPGTSMPAWGETFNDAELHSLILYLETLSPRFAEEPRNPEDVIADVKTLEPPPPTPELLAKGKLLYDKVKCFDCHGAKGRGDGPSALTTKNSDGTRSHVFDFSYGLYKGGTSPSAVYRTFATGLNGTPMPAYDKTVPNETDRWALVYYCLSLSRPRGLWFYLTERPRWDEPMAPRPMSGDATQSVAEHP